MTTTTPSSRSAHAPQARGRSALTIVLAVALFLSIAFLTPATADAAEPVTSNCEISELVDEQCRFETEPTSAETCPEDAEIVVEPRGCAYLVDPDTSLCLAPIVAGGCEQLIDLVEELRCAEGEEITAEQTCFYFAPGTYGYSCSAGELRDDGQTCRAVVANSVLGCPTLGSVGACFDIVARSVCLPGFDQNSDRCRRDVEAIVVGPQTECEDGYVEEGTTCLLYFRDSAPTNEPSCLWEIARWVNGECLIGSYPLRSSGGETCEARAGVFGIPRAGGLTDCYELAAGDPASQCPAGTVEAASGECRAAVAATNICPAGTWVEGSECAGYFLADYALQCPAGAALDAESDLCRVPSEPPILVEVCPTDGNGYVNDAAECVHFVQTQDLCGDPAVWFDEHQSCGIGVGYLIVLGCPAGQVLEDNVCAQYEAAEFFCFDEAVTINMLFGDDGIGTAGADVILGTNGPDDIRGQTGADRICGMGGNDTIRGGRDADFISGGSGDDDIRGGRGNDFVHGGEGNDVIRGKRGDDHLHGSSGDDLLLGGRGDDTLRGGPGIDDCRGKRDIDTTDDASCETTSTVENVFGSTP